MLLALVSFLIGLIIGFGIGVIGQFGIIKNHLRWEFDNQPPDAFLTNVFGEGDKTYTSKEMKTKIEELKQKGEIIKPDFFNDKLDEETSKGGEIKLGDLLEDDI